MTQRSQRERVVPHRFADFEMVSDEQVDDDGDLVHIALMAGAEPVDEKEVVTQPVWRDAMHEELKSIEKNETKFKRIVGSLRYLCNSRTYLAYSVGLISRFMSNPKKSHMLATKRLLRYIQGTTDYGILFPIGQ